MSNGGWREIWNGYGDGNSCQRCPGNAAYAGKDGNAGSVGNVGGAGEDAMLGLLGTSVTLVMLRIARSIGEDAGNTTSVLRSFADDAAAGGMSTMVPLFVGNMEL